MMVGRPWGSVVALLALFFVSSCDAETPGPAPEPATDGPMQVDVGAGGMSVNAPAGVENWSATFGFLWPCTTGAEARITKVEPTGNVAADAFRTWVHTVPAGREDLTPLGSILGSPPRFDESYTEPFDHGTFKADAVGHVVANACPVEYEPGTGVEELLVTLDTGPAGVAVDGFKVTYVADGRAYVTDVAWTMTLCGTEFVEECS